MGSSFTFVPPPEAPVFRPTEDEFRDPLEYLMKIRHIGTKTGICKIIPPKLTCGFFKFTPQSWNPPFAVNMKEFSFTPRIQRLYELEGGDKIRVPSIGGRYLDLHSLHKEVRSAGGYEKIDDYLCRICGQGDDEDNLLVCDTDKCQACYHTYCLNPPLRSVPKCQWKCPECIRSMCLKPPEPYGFPQSNKCYSLHEFGVMADEFKSKYFGRPCTVSLTQYLHFTGYMW
ncbi:unnamed protein product [Echinostoma caproni]|uniref:[histone H3]-trimethyl-L-lysine(4) demethylase n=1 Tax=Echinostoma caproni TaxID=27848 RepID=A0A183BA95_9TREM|nr:unnamed protein product [Echinostoma caproni]